MTFGEIRPSGPAGAIGSRGRPQPGRYGGRFVYSPRQVPALTGALVFLAALAAVGGLLLPVNIRPTRCCPHPHSSPSPLP